MMPEMGGHVDATKEPSALTVLDFAVAQHTLALHQGE